METAYRYILIEKFLILKTKYFFQKYICNMRSSIRIGNQNGGAMEPSLAESDEDIENRKKEKEAYIQSYAAEFKN